MRNVIVGTLAFGAGIIAIAEFLAVDGVLILTTGRAIQTAVGTEAATVATNPSAREQVKTVVENAAKEGVNFADDVLSTATRTSTKYGNSVEVLLKNGNKMDINATRVKEWIPNLHPNAPAGTFNKVKFENFLPNSKGFKRAPTQSELDFLNSLFK